MLNPQLKDLAVFGIQDTSKLLFGLIASRISNPTPRGEYLKEYEKLIQKEGVALPIAAAVDIEKSEVEEMRSLIASAITLLETEKIEDAKQKIEKAVAETSCERCSRKLVQLNWQDKASALNYLRTMFKLLPAYYDILEGESAMQISHTNTNTQVDSETKIEAIKKSEKGKGEGEELAKNIEEECESCAASQIVELCQWDTACLDEVIAFIETQKAKGLKVMNDELVRKAKAFSAKTD